VAVGSSGAGAAAEQWDGRASSGCGALDDEGAAWAAAGSDAWALRHAAPSSCAESHELRHRALRACSLSSSSGGLYSGGLYAVDTDTEALLGSGGAPSLRLAALAAAGGVYETRGSVL